MDQDSTNFQLSNVAMEAVRKAVQDISPELLKVAHDYSQSETIPELYHHEGMVDMVKSDSDDGVVYFYVDDEFVFGFDISREDVFHSEHINFVPGSTVKIESFEGQKVRGEIDYVECNYFHPPQLAAAFVDLDEEDVEAVEWE